MELEQIAQETPRDVLISRLKYHTQCLEEYGSIPERYNYHMQKIMEFSLALEKIRS